MKNYYQILKPTSGVYYVRAERLRLFRKFKKEGYLRSRQRNKN